ncbi:ubiquitin-specific protease otu1 [Polyrhizophydium stewartii]|uniref:Ubiquitin thioesterase OTU n=1 Tax=Polyrhizophydium stewartii TaxID=2732419 RepID=A0ABR4NHZ5_9FUNG
MAALVRPATVPAAAAPAAPSATDESGVRMPDGRLVVREMVDDNSCLFRTIGFIFERDAEAAPRLRKLVSAAIAANPLEYSEAILGRSPAAYMSWIEKPSSWGGAIELAIFADHYRVEIDSIDVATGRMDRFGEGRFTSRAFVLYSGIHYDALALSPSEGAPAEFDQTVFEGAAAERAAAAAQQLAQIWKQRRRFTDTARFTLRCGDCGQRVAGEREALAHAAATGHGAFSEV